jgi:hypothetical protein
VRREAGANQEEIDSEEDSDEEENEEDDEDEAHEYLLGTTSGSKLVDR